MATLMDVLRVAVEGQGLPAGEVLVEEDAPGPQFCEMCRNYRDVDAHGLCADCARSVARGYEISVLAGRCANGAERDAGTLFHARWIEDGEVSLRAVCGAEPGRRSVGWSSWSPPERQVTCERCLRKLGQVMASPQRDVIEHYCAVGVITERARLDWLAARDAFLLAVADPTQHRIGAWVRARRHALRNHAPTGDAWSDLIESSFNPCSMMTEALQLERLVAQEPESELGRMARVEIEKRHWWERQPTSGQLTLDGRLVMV